MKSRPYAAILFSWLLVLFAVILPRFATVPDGFAIGIWIAALAVQAVIIVQHFMGTGTGPGRSPSGPSTA